MIYAVWFDLEDYSNKDIMEYFKINLSSPYWKSVEGDYRFNSSAYCGALFLGIL